MSPLRRLWGEEPICFCKHLQTLLICLLGFFGFLGVLPFAGFLSFIHFPLFL